MAEQDEFEKEINEGLKKHLIRNNAFLEKYNSVEAFDFMNEYILNMSTEPMIRSEVGDVKFDSSLRLLGCYNAIMTEMANDEFDEQLVKNLLDKISDCKTKLS